MLLVRSTSLLPASRHIEPQERRGRHRGRKWQWQALKVGGTKVTRGMAHTCRWLNSRILLCARLTCTRPIVVGPLVYVIPQYLAGVTSYPASMCSREKKEIPSRSPEQTSGAIGCVSSQHRRIQSIACGPLRFPSSKLYYHRDSRATPRPDYGVVS